MTKQAKQDTAKAVKLLATLDSLHLKAFAAETREALGFVMLNDTVQLCDYQRAYLWNLQTGSKPELIGISGQRETKDDAPLIEKLGVIVGEIKSPHIQQTLSDSSLTGGEEEWQEFHGAKHAPTVHWVPIFARDKLQLGLWLERWHDVEWEPQEQDALRFLSQGYGLAWQRFMSSFFSRVWSKRRGFMFLAFVALCMTFIQLPLRIVAPCEVIALDPIVVTAPLEGIIKEIVVEPGQDVAVGDVLVEYDKQVLEQALRVAEKEVEIADSELHKATTQAFEDPDSLAQVGTLHLELQKERVNLALAEYRVGQLEIKAPGEGVVNVDDPDQWRGKPVQVGERIMTITRPQQTKLRIWIPENDNVSIRSDRKVRVFLNVSPEFSIPAQLTYIANHTIVSDLGVASFVAEAEWDEDEEIDLKTGLKGTAVLYGDDVSLFYWIMRRPWAALRELTGW